MPAKEENEAFRYLSSSLIYINLVVGEVVTTFNLIGDLVLASSPVSQAMILLICFQTWHAEHLAKSENTSTLSTANSPELASSDALLWGNLRCLKRNFRRAQTMCVLDPARGSHFAIA